jgi:hypothetical protein
MVSDDGTRQSSGRVEPRLERCRAGLQIFRILGTLEFIGTAAAALLSPLSRADADAADSRP